MDYFSPKRVASKISDIARNIDKAEKLGRIPARSKSKTNIVLHPIMDGKVLRCVSRTGKAYYAAVYCSAYS